MPPATFLTIAFGCRVNEAEKTVLDRKLTAAGLTYNTDDPGVVVVNTCAVTAKAEHEARQELSRLRRTYPSAVIVVTGCAATRWIRDCERMPAATLMVSNTDKASLDERIRDILGDLAPGNGPDGLRPAPDKFTGSGRLMVKIQDGCHRFCSYCIVPYLRGTPVSRRIADILDDIATSPFPVTDVTLTAINTEAFGKDTGETLPGLIDAILTRTQVPRISFGSIHPWSLDDTFMSYYETIADNPRFVPFFHVPLQSGCDTVLSRMNRQYTVSSLMDSLRRIRRAQPMSFIGTDVIVGFPGESDEEFRQTCMALEHAPIDRFHVFRYSVRPGTAASRMERTCAVPPPDTARDRSERLREIGQRNLAAARQRAVGYKSRALVLRTESGSGRDILLGNNLPAVLPACTHAPGSVVDVVVGSEDGGLLVAGYAATG